MNKKVNSTSVRKGVSSGVATDLAALTSMDLGLANIGSLISGDGLPSVDVSQTGKVVWIASEDLLDSPTQPRDPLTPADVEDLRVGFEALIDEGKPPILHPLIIAPHPTEPGKWEKKDGHRRHFAGQLLKIELFPCLINPDYDEYDQVAGNIQANGHTPMELARFIQRKVQAGDAKGKIAKRLGQKPAFISKHLKVLEMPPLMLQAYNEGRLSDVEAIYLLVTQFEKYPEQIDEFCSTQQKITQQSARALIESLQGPVMRPPAPVVHIGGNGTLSGNGSLGSPTGGSASPADAHADGHGPFSGAKDGQEGAGSVGGSTPSSGVQNGLAGDSGAPSGPKEGAGKPLVSPKPKRPVIRIMFKKREAVLLTDRAAENGAGWIRFADDNQELELPANSQITFIGAQAD